MLGNDFFIDRLGPQGGETNVIIEDGFLGQFQGAQESFDVVRGDLGDGGVGFQIVLEFLESGAVVAQGVGTEVARFCCQQVACNGFENGMVLRGVFIRYASG